MLSRSTHDVCWWQVMNAYCKVYPTPPPSRRPIRVKQARLAAEKAARRAAQAGGQEGKGDAQDADKPTRHQLGMFLSQARQHEE